MFKTWFRIVAVIVALCAQSRFCLAETSASTATIFKLKETIQSSKTVADFVRTIPGDTTHIQKLLKVYFPEVSRSGFDPVSFNVDQKWLQFGKARFGFSKIEKGVVEYAGKQLSYNPNFFEFYASTYKAMPKATAFVRLLMDEAFAQNRDAFPELQSHEKRAEERAEVTMDEAAFVPLMGLSFFKNKPAKTVGKFATRLVIPAIVSFWALHYSRAFTAPDCSAQAKEIRDTLTAGKIGLAELNCAEVLSARATISFWTPDKKKLPFVADWTAGELWVNRDEVYHFGYRKLTSVEINKPGKNITLTKGSPEFAEYAKNLEPYRQVLHIMGKYNSCFRCATEIEKALKTDKPITEEGAESHAAPAVVQ